MIKYPLVIAGWIACGVLSAGFVNASLRADPRLLQDTYSASQYWAFSLGFGFLYGPIALVLSWPLTGGWEGGWTLSKEPVPVSWLAPPRLR